ncbi:unnamed protein product [Ectocarpus sp. 8 AP-2014]
MPPTIAFIKIASCSEKTNKNFHSQTHTIAKKARAVKTNSQATPHRQPSHPAVVNTDDSARDDRYFPTKSLGFEPATTEINPPCFGQCGYPFDSWLLFRRTHAPVEQVPCTTERHCSRVVCITDARPGSLSK